MQVSHIWYWFRGMCRTRNWYCFSIRWKVCAVKGGRAFTNKGMTYICTCIITNMLVFIQHFVTFWPISVLYRSGCFIIIWSPRAHEWDGEEGLHCVLTLPHNLPYSGKLSREKTASIKISRRKLSRIHAMDWICVACACDVREENFRELAHTHEIRKSFLPRKFPVIR